jgi:hypothetical protein
VSTRRVVFLDAEGTPWRPRPGRSDDEYRQDASVERADDVFEPEPGAHRFVRLLNADGHRIVVLSGQVPAFPESLLEHYRFRDLVDDFVALQPPFDRRRLVDPAVVEDEVQVKLGGRGLIDVFEQRDEFLVAVPFLEFRDDAAGDRVQGRKERGRPVPFVVVRLVLGQALPDRQNRP